jgi:hypothetical protein
VLCFKTDEAALWRSYMKAAGRESDGRFFGVDEAYRFNFLDYEAKTSGVDFAENLVTLLVDIASIQKRTEATGSEAHFWLPQKKKLLRNAVSLLLLAEEPVQLRVLYEMILAAPKSLDDVSAASWQAGSCLFQLLERAEHRAARGSLELEMIKRYWLLAGVLANALARAQLQSVERHTVRLKRNRARLQRKSRSRDDFIVS